MGTQKKDMRVCSEKDKDNRNDDQSSFVRPFQNVRSVSNNIDVTANILTIATIAMQDSLSVMNGTLDDPCISLEALALTSPHGTTTVKDWPLLDLSNEEDYDDSRRITSTDRDIERASVPSKDQVQNQVEHVSGSPDFRSIAEHPPRYHRNNHHHHHHSNQPSAKGRSSKVLKKWTKRGTNDSVSSSLGSNKMNKSRHGGIYSLLLRNSSTRASQTAVKEQDSSDDRDHDYNNNVSNHGAQELPESLCTNNMHFPEGKTSKSPLGTSKTISPSKPKDIGRTIDHHCHNLSNTSSNINRHGGIYSILRKREIMK